MGGNAMAPFGARRFKRCEYLTLAKEVMEKFKSILPNKMFSEIISYHEKASFGDMDVLCLILESKDYEAIKEEFQVKHFVRNSNVMSFLYKELQIDVIPMQYHDYFTAHSYYAYNDIGNLLGKLFHKFGLKYGHRGLTMPMRDGTNMFREVVVSKDTTAILSFLELDPQKYYAGFDTLEDIFKYVVSSPYFSPTPFKFENLTSVDRIRDRKRDTYQKFVKYVENIPDGYKFNSDKSTYLPKIFEAFPSAKAEYDDALRELERTRRAKELFNGNLVMEWTGLKEKELGTLIQIIKGSKNHFPGLEKLNFTDWVLIHSKDEIKEYTLKAFEMYKLIKQE